MPTRLSEDRIRLSERHSNLSIDVRLDECMSGGGGQGVNSPAKSCCKKTGAGVLILVGLCFIGAGVSGGLFIPDYLDTKATDVEVCSLTSGGFESWESTRNTEVPTYKYYYAFDMTNGDDYAASGAAPELHERGPYVIRQWVTKAGTTFAEEGMETVAAFTAWYEYEYESDLSCTGCEKTDAVTNLSPGWLTLLGTAFTERTFLLQAYGCTETQIGLSATAAATCSSAQRGDDTFACRCCDPTPTAVSDETSGEIACSDLYEFGGSAFPYAPQTSFISYLASLDGGAIAKSSASLSSGSDGACTLGGGECLSATTCSADLLNATATTVFQAQDPADPLFLPFSVIYNVLRGEALADIAAERGWDSLTNDICVTGFMEPEVHTPLVLTKSVHEFAFGFPSATLGYIQAGLGETSVVSYTADVAEVCGASCSTEDDASCVITDNTDASSGLFIPSTWAINVNGFADAKEAITDDALKYLAEIDCRPYTFTYLTKAMCHPDNRHVGDTDCVCSSTAMGLDSGVDFSSDDFNGCCLYSGSALNFQLTDIAGFGCLYQTPGYVDSQTYETEALFEASEPQEQKESMGCYDVSDINNQKEYKAATSLPVWPAEGGVGVTDYSSGQVISQAKVQTYQSNLADLMGGQAASALLFKFEAVDGSMGAQFPPQGITSSFASSDWSSGERGADEYGVYITQVLRQVPVDWEKETTLKGIKVNEYRPSPDLLSGTDDSLPGKDAGAATPTAGLMSVGFVGEFLAYVSRPHWMYGNTSWLYSQNDQIVLMSTVGDYGDNTAPLSADSAVPIDEAFVESHVDHFETYLQIEPATGKTMNGHKRLQASFAVWGCDPDDSEMPACALGGGLGQGYYNLGYPGAPVYNCYADATAGAQDPGTGTVVPNFLGFPCSAANAFTPNVKADVVIPQYWMDETATLTDDLADQFKMAGTYKQMSQVGLFVGPALGLVTLLAGLVQLRSILRKPY